MVMNPNSGPGSAADPAYGQAVQAAQRAGIKVIGYVYTSNGARPRADVEAEIDQYENAYLVDGIFFDEADPPDCNSHRFYADIVAYAKAHTGGFTVMNPGTEIDECYMDTADVIVDFESDCGAYANWQPPAYAVNYPANRFWHIVYACNAGSLANTVALSKARNAGYLYVTDDDLPNPYDTLPGYWTAEVAAVSGP
jgi:hypothetical protein